MKEIVMRGLRAAADLLLPRVCTVCGRRLHTSEEHICLLCRADLPRTYFWRQSHNPMADKFNEGIQSYIAENGSPKHERYAYAAALFHYSAGTGYRHITHQLKYHGNIRLGEHFGRMLGNCLAVAEWFGDVDLVIPVPLHWSRKLKRGYNQAEVLGRAIASSLNVETRTDIIRRKRRTATQTKLDIEQKRKNVTGAFEVVETVRRLSTEYRHILLVDDVFTTGSTLMACFTALREVFPPSVRISVATLGFVGSP